MEFESEDVAKIVAETMNNYLFGERLLKCKCSYARVAWVLAADGWLWCEGRRRSCLDTPRHSGLRLSGDGAKIPVHFPDDSN